MIDLYYNNYKNSVTILKNQIENNKLSHAYLFETNNIDIPISFVKSILLNELKDNYDKLNINELIENNDFPDLEMLETDNLFYKKEEVKKLLFKFDTKPLISKYKIYIIKEVDKLKDEVANEMLKFIEEPSDGVIAILMSNNTDKIINTIKSRCQILRFNETLKNNIIDEEKLEMVINFAFLLEKAKKNSIIYEKKFILSHFTSKEDIYIFFNILKNVYMDLIFISSGKNPVSYKQYKNKYNMFKKQEQKYIYKINKIDNLKERIKANCNINLILDKLIIGLGEE